MINQILFSITVLAPNDYENKINRDKTTIVILIIFRPSTNSLMCSSAQAKKTERAFWSTRKIKPIQLFRHTLVSKSDEEQQIVWKMCYMVVSAICNLYLT